MLPVEQIVPFIRHEDPLVRELAVECLKDVRHPGRLTGDFVLDAVRAGHAEVRYALRYFEISAEVLAYALECLATEPEEPLTLAWNRAMRNEADNWAPWVIFEAPDALFTPEVIEKLGGLDERIGWSAEERGERVEMMALPTERLQAYLLETCAAHNTDGTAQSEHGDVQTIVGRLAQRPECYDWAELQLKAFARTGSWEEVWLVELLKLARRPTALQFALQALPGMAWVENQSLYDVMISTIGNMAEPQHLPHLAAMWERGDAELRQSLVNALENLRFPEAEPLLLRVARETEDPTVRTNVAIGLCEMLATSEEAREFIHDLTDREAFDIVLIDLEEMAIPHGIILGKPYAEEEAWRQRLTHLETRKQERRQRMFPGLDRMFSEMAQRTADADLLPPVEMIKPEGAFEPSDRVPQLTAAKTVGRNEPCPCGSGKKYKKCCGK